MNKDSREECNELSNFIELILLEIGIKLCMEYFKFFEWIVKDSVLNQLEPQTFQNFFFHFNYVKLGKLSMGSFKEHIVHCEENYILNLWGDKAACKPNEMEMTLFKHLTSLLLCLKVVIEKLDCYEESLVCGFIKDSEDLDHPVNHLSSMSFAN